MDIKEKRILLTLITSVMTFAFYIIYVYQKILKVNLDLLNDFKFWGKSFLILIPVAIVVQIVVHIGFAIYIKVTSDEEIDPIDDERDKLIELKAIKISHHIFIVGFALSMGSLAMDMRPWVMFVILLSSGFIASIVNEILRLYYYRKGI